MNREIYLTIDIDWASDEILNYTLELLKQHHVSATFFVTHDTPLLRKIREKGDWELGIHPNFNKSLLGQELKDYKRIIDESIVIVPEAVSTRSHALTQNTLISNYLAYRGIKYDLNVYIPVESCMVLQPYKSPGGCIRVPFYFEDDMWFSETNPCQNMDTYFQKEGLKVFCFHPIHIFLNTENPCRYERARSIYHDAGQLKKIRNDAVIGTKDILLSILERGKEGQYEFKKINQIEGCV